MGSFLVVSCSGESFGEAKARFDAGIAAARFLKGRVPDRIHSGDSFLAASFRRPKDSSARLVSHPATGSWLVTSGTWFHAGRFGPGDESVLLSRFLESGAQNLAGEIDGFFAMAIGDGRTGDVHLVTDIIGSCHAYSRVFAGCVAISDSSVMLAAMGDNQFDNTGCQEFLGTGIIYEDRTPFLEVRKTEPASVYAFFRGIEKSRSRYWRPESLVPDSLDGSNAVGGLWSSLVDSARVIHSRFPRTVCDLTGGYDSRVVVAAFHGAGVPFAVTVSGRPDTPDVRISREIAGKFGWEHLHVDANEAGTMAEVKAAFPYTDGEYNLLEYSRILTIHKSLSERFDISVNGSFGEVARGYWWEDLFPHAGTVRPLDTEFFARKRYAWQPFDPSLFPPETRLDLVRHFKGVIERTNAELAGFPNTYQMDNTYLRMRMHRWQGRIASSTNQLWPCISPFMFRPVLETLLRTNWRIRRRSLLPTKVLATYSPSLASFPLEHGQPAMPPEWRNLHRFLPLIGYYGGKVADRIARKFRHGGSLSQRRTGEAQRRLSLWGEEEVRSLLDPSRMHLANSMDPEPLGAFLKSSRSMDFPHGEQWARLLTLEYMVSRVGEFRKTGGNR